MREQFEKLPDIAERLHTVVYNEDFNQYHAAIINSGLSVKYIQGAWYAFQEQQKKIDIQECGAKEIISIINSITPYEYDLDTMSKINKIKELLK